MFTDTASAALCTLDSVKGTSLDVHRSNRGEHLVDALLEKLRRPLSSPLQKELIVVQGPGMATWLNMQLSLRAGVWANTEYLYPKKFVDRIFATVLDLPETAEAIAAPYSPESLLWTVAARLPLHLEDPAFEALRRYVGSPIDEARLFMLAARIAQTYDEYLTYRPNLVRLWAKSDALFAEPQLELFQEVEASDPAIWQRKLWRDIETVLGPNHASAFERKCLTNLQRKKRISGLPERISVFGLSTLPPMYVRLLVALNKHVPVSLFLFSPCREYFGDIILRDSVAFAPNDGNRLLRAFGSQAAEFNHVLSETCEALGVIEHELHAYEQPQRQTLLQRLQGDVLDFCESSAATDSTDRSVQFHSCHSPIREVEVLHDQVLELVHTHGYSPDEILVMLPDVEAYAPLIDAVFRRDDERFLPYRITDRRAESEAVVLKAFLRLLGLASERVTAAQVIDLLTLPVVHRRFGMVADDVQTVTTWLADAHITWGIDERHRHSEVPHSSAVNSWQSGLDRLLLGYAVDSGGDELVLGIYPGEHIEGKAALLLGSFARFTSTLFQHLNEFRKARVVDEWQTVLTAALHDLVQVDAEQHWQYQQVLDTLDAVRQHAASAGYDAALEIRVMSRLLDQRLEQRTAARGFLASGITVCAMVPMRNVPFKVICIMGMNDGAFPREAYRPDFNLLEHGDEARRPGDPHRRNDDRYLFLEALCSARERFIVTFIGQSVRDNTPCPPSVVVTELLETLSAMQNGAAEGPATRRERTSNPTKTLPVHVVTRHPLQPFNPRYFAPSRNALFSYAKEFVPLAADIDSRTVARPFLSAPLAPSSERADTLSLAELSAFYRAPTRTLVEKRLGVRWQEHTVELPERDLTSLDGLQVYKLGDPLMRRELASVPLQQSRKLAELSGLLPSGMLGEFEHRQLEETALPLSSVARALMRGRTPTRQVIRVDIGDTLITGTVADVFDNARISVQFARVTGKTLLTRWLEHLALAAQCEEYRITSPSLITGRAAAGGEPVVWQLSPVQKPEPILESLIELFRVGGSVPLPLFPELSFEYAAAPKRMTATKLADGWGKTRERDAAIVRIYGDDCPLQLNRPLLPTSYGLPPLTFSDVALQVFGPLIAHLTKLEWREVLQ